MLIWGIGGGVATAALRDRAGARRPDDRHVAAATRSSSVRANWARTLTVNHRTGDVVAAVEGGIGGADLVVETVGEATWKRSLAAVKPGGRVVGLRRDERPEPARRSCTGSGGSS